MICQGCGGVLGRDCYNQYDCMQISKSIEYQEVAEPYIEALKEANDLIDFMCNHMQLKDRQMQEAMAIKIDNTVALMNTLIPPPPKTQKERDDFIDNLPF